LPTHKNLTNFVVDIEKLYGVKLGAYFLEKFKTMSMFENGKNDRK